MKVKNFKYYNVDSHKLNDLIVKTGKTKTEISTSMGFADSFMSNVLTRKKISYPAANLLNTIYGISVEDYVKTSDSDTETAQESNVIDYSKLEDCIYNAIIRANNAIAEARRKANFETL